MNDTLRMRTPYHPGSGFTDENCKARALQKMTRDLFRAMSLAPRQKCPRNVVEMKEVWQ